MTLEAGSQLLHYRLLEKIGEGGMGVVWKAVDTELDREVAIKLLPAAFAADEERLARFRREAKLLASLNHPNIAVIYGLHEGEGSIRFLAMELVAGEDLSQRLARGPLPIDDAIAVATQIASALEASHGQGVIHRDLKPANVLLAPDGTVKVLDFGLAKSLEGGGSQADLSQSPTVTSLGTQAGVILGTAAYMSPEQAKGRPLDRRSDIWSFGVMLHEMVSGRCSFSGESVSETLAEVLKGEPDWSALPAATPAALRRLLERCLVKDAGWRLADMADARIELRAAAQDEPEHAVAAAAPARSGALTRLFAAIALAAIATAVWLAQRPAADSGPTRLEIALPHGESIAGRPAISPDGRTVAYQTVSGAGTSQLYLRDLSDFEPRRLPGISGHGGPFFSPDGKELAFASQGSLWKVAVDGGTPTPLVETLEIFGGTWAADGSIVWAPGLNAGLYRLRPGSTTAERVTEPDSAAAGYAHVFPQALPDGRILYTRWGETEEKNYILDLETGESIPIRGSRLSQVATALYAPGHVLVGDRQTGLQLAPLELGGGAAMGTARNVASGVFWEQGIHLPSAAVSAEGTLVYAAGDPSRCRLVWFDRRGAVTTAVEEEQDYRFPELSPDGGRVALTVGPDVVVIDLERGTQTKIAAFRGDHLSFRPQWLPDGKRVLFGSNVSGRWDLYVTNADGTGSIEPYVDWEPTAYADSVSRDGTLLMASPGDGTGSDLWMLEPGGVPEPYLLTPSNEWASRFSPDGTLVAYASNSSGRPEIYVQTFPAGDERTQISVAGGASAAWSPDGSRLYYTLDGVMWEVSVQRSPLRFGRPERLFAGDIAAGNWTRFTVAPGENGDRFLMQQPLPEAIPDRLRVVIGWGDEVGLDLD
jgi:Tol biopolymer transport system component